MNKNGPADGSDSSFILHPSSLPRRARTGGRRKPDPETAALRRAIGGRLVQLARDRHPYHGGAGMAQELSVTYRRWWMWTAGQAMPGRDLLRLLELTGAEPKWLLDGTGPRYRDGRPTPAPSPETIALDRALRRWIKANKRRPGRPRKDRPMRA